MTGLGSVSINYKLWFCILLLVQVPVVNLLAHVQLDYPTGGETFEAGELVSVHWHEIVHHNLLNWDLYFSSDGGTSWQVIKEDISADQISYQWTVPEAATENARVRIVQDNQNADYDDASGDFTITAIAASVQTGNDIPLNFVLRTNYPNPFNPGTVIEYGIPQNSGGSDSEVSIKVYNTLGSEVTTLIEGPHRPGMYKVEFNGSGLPSGIYIYRMSGYNQILTRKMMLIK